MRKLANLFLVLFLIAAILGIANELLHLFLNFQYFAGLQQLIWFALIGVGSLVYLGFGFNKHLPKLILIPLFIWLFWNMVDYWPLENAIGSYFRLYASCGQFLLGAAVLRLNRKINNERLLLARSQFIGPAFSGRNLFRFCLISIPIMPIALLLTSYAVIDSLIEETTAGFVQLKPNGLYMTERIYQQENKQIRLTGMIHLGQEDFYANLMASIPNGRTLILAEGVTDEEGLMTERFGYGKIADLLGLTSQENVHFQGRLIGAIELDEIDIGEQNTPDILRADIDLKQFDPRTLEVLNALAKYILNADSLADGYLEFNRWTQEHTTPDLNGIIMDDLINKRNQSVIGYLPKALNKYDTVVIPWGALHMKGIETAVQEKGFALESSHERLSIDFLLLPYGRLWEKLTRAE